MTVGNRSSLYGHLAAFLPCSKDTLLKRAKTLRVKEMDDKIREPMQKLKDGRSICIDFYFTLHIIKTYSSMSYISLDARKWVFGVS